VPQCKKRKKKKRERERMKEEKNLSVTDMVGREILCLCVLSHTQRVL
jgi:hypothetical protein